MREQGEANDKRGNPFIWRLHGQRDGQDKQGIEKHRALSRAVRRHSPTQQNWEQYPAGERANSGQCIDDGGRCADLRLPQPKLPRKEIRRPKQYEPPDKVSQQLGPCHCPRPPFLQQCAPRRTFFRWV